MRFSVTVLGLGLWNCVASCSSEPPDINGPASRYSEGQTTMSPVVDDRFKGRANRLLYDQFNVKTE